MKETEKKLIDAVSAIIETEGFAKLGVNNIAKRTGCDKVLLYRYFGGLDGLLGAWARHNDFYTGSFDGIAREIEQREQIDVREITKKILVGQMQFLRTNRMMQQLLLWEISGNEKFPHLRELREEKGNRLQLLLEDKSGHADKTTAMQVVILIAAIDYIVLATNDYPMMNGIDFSNEQSWDLLQKTLEGFMDMMFDKIDGQ